MPTTTICLPPGTVVRILSDFSAPTSCNQVSVTHGESVQILEHDELLKKYFVRKLSNPENEDGWIPFSVIHSTTNTVNNESNGDSTGSNHQTVSSNNKKLWPFKFRKPSFSGKQREKENAANNAINGGSLIGTQFTRYSSSGNNGSCGENNVDFFDEKLPFFAEEVKPMKCESGEQVRLSCQLLVSPNEINTEPVTVFWKDAFGHVIRDDKKKHSLSFSQQTGVCHLIISDCRLSDSGRYTCTATNDAGSCSTSGVLTVLGKSFSHVISHAACHFFSFNWLSW